MHLVAVDVFVDGFAAATRPGRIPGLNDKVSLDEVEQIEMKSLHFAEFQKIETTFRSLFHVEIDGDITHVRFYDNRHRGCCCGCLGSCSSTQLDLVERLQLRSMRESKKQPETAGTRFFFL